MDVRRIIEPGHSVGHEGGNIDHPIEEPVAPSKLDPFRVLFPGRMRRHNVLYARDVIIPKIRMMIVGQ